MKLFITVFLSLCLFGCSDSENNSKQLDKKIACNAWSHPNKDSVPNILPTVQYNIGQGIRLDLTQQPVNLPGKPAWSEEKLKNAGFIGKNMGSVLITVPSDGDYIFWVTTNSFITPYNEENKGIDAKRYVENCNEENHFKRGVEFPLKAGIYTVQISYTKESQTLLKVTETQP